MCTFNQTQIKLLIQNKHARPRKMNLNLADAVEDSLTDAAPLGLRGAARQRLHPPDGVPQVDVVVVGHVQKHVLKLAHSEVASIIAALDCTFITNNVNILQTNKSGLKTSTDLYFAWSSLS